MLGAVGFSVDFHDLSQCLIKLWTIRKTQLLDQKVFLHSFEFRFVRTRNSGGIGILDARATTDCDLGQEIHVCRHVAFCF